MFERALVSVLSSNERLQFVVQFCHSFHHQRVYDHQSIIFIAGIPELLVDGFLQGPKFRVIAEEPISLLQEFGMSSRLNC
jgi:hypothetical protein